MAKIIELNKEVKMCIKWERKRLIKNKMKDSSSQTFWHTLGRGNRDDEFVILKDDGETITDEESVAQAFSDFFQSKVNKLIEVNPIADTVEDFAYVPIPEITDKEMEIAIFSFKPKKSTGPDEIPLLILKSCFNAILDPAKRLLNSIIAKGFIPKAWKLARLKPIFKKGAKNKNYIELQANL
jgi:hypothetical protein